MDTPHVYFRLMLTALRRDSVFVLPLSDADIARLIADSLQATNPNDDDVADTAACLHVAFVEMADACDAAELSWYAASVEDDVPQ